MGFEPTTSSFRTAVTPNSSIIQDTDSACHGQFKEKEKTPATELDVFLSKKIFRRKIIIKSK